MLTPAQIKTLKLAGLQLNQLTENELTEIASRSDCEHLSDEQLIEFLTIANALYRGGEPFISDHIYDSVFLAELRKRQPDHPYLHNVEPEPAFTGKTVQLPERMLSTEKAYTRESIEKWLKRVEKAAQELNLDFSSLQLKATPKLDGFAAYDDGKVLYTRGDGRKGTDISRVFERGLKVGGSGKRGLGAGEIVINKTYFNEHLADHFENARNFQASIIKEKELDELVLQAIKNQAALFYPFAELPCWQGNAASLLADFETIVETVRNKVDFDVDGVVFEVVDDQLKQHMGFTRHHHRWQIAFKNNAESKQVKVIRIIAQTSRSGRVNPVAELVPTRLSGALISRATAHHFGMVKELGIGPGALIELTRSGQVIPKIERVILPKEPQIPEQCPSCSSQLIWDSDYLYCLNKTHCPAQIEHTIEHFFKILANIDGFGKKTIEKLHQAGIKSVYEVYQLDMERLQTIGFGEKTSENLLAQLIRSRTEAIEDWRFLGAFGIHRMGLGNCEQLLRHYPLAEIFALTVEDIVEIEGFAEKSAVAVVASLQEIREEFEQIYHLGFNLIPSPISTAAEAAENASPIFGKTIVFTGKMHNATRDEMKKQAKQLGAKVGSSVSSKTDYLVTGENVGVTKINAAKEKGVAVLTEEEYYSLIGMSN
jgi:DNA ligase (NAD+)